MYTPLYIHYGASKFDSQKGFPIKNSEYMSALGVKPIGGLWASRIDEGYGWKEWCKENDFRNCDEQKRFKFILKENATTIEIHSAEDIIGKPWFKRNPLFTMNFIDYEMLVHNGVDALEMRNIASPDGLYWLLYGWDCNSIVVLNPDVIKQVHYG